jgi:predicted XRE-type DNA-binding protein
MRFPILRIAQTLVFGTMGYGMFQLIKDDIKKQEIFNNLSLEDQFRKKLTDEVTYQKLSQKGIDNGFKLYATSMNHFFEKKAKLYLEENPELIKQIEQEVDYKMKNIEIRKNWYEADPNKYQFKFDKSDGIKEIEEWYLEKSLESSNDLKFKK